MKASSRHPVNKRREVLKVMAGLPLLGTMAFRSFEEENLFTSGTVKNKSIRDQIKGEIPHARIKELEVSRMIMGGNLFGGWAHSRDLMYVSDLVKVYHTEEKMFRTMQMAEEAGVNSIITNPVLIPVLQKYWKQGGRIRFISDGGFDYKTGISQSVDAGAAACYVHGGLADNLAKAGKLDDLAEALEKIKSSGIPAGIGAHELETIKKCTDYGLVPDFWMKTLHKSNYWSSEIDNERKSTLDKEFADNIFCQNADETISFMNNLEQPWIAYKILAAGAIKPRDAFKWAFEQGADFICVGMFDFQMVENVNLALEVLNGRIERTRPWRA